MLITRFLGYSDISNQYHFIRNRRQSQNPSCHHLHREAMINDKSFNREEKFKVQQQLILTWTGRLNILHSAARKSLLHTKSGLAGCICRMSHLPAHFIMTDTGSTILLDWRAVKSTCRRNKDLRYIARKTVIGIFIWRWTLTAITFAHKMKRVYEWFCKAGTSRSVLNHVSWLKGWQSLQCFNDCVAFPQHYSSTRRFGNWTYLHRLSRGRVPRERESNSYS